MLASRQSPDGRNDGCFGLEPLEQSLRIYFRQQSLEISFYGVKGIRDE
jgi:hypothetical protein